MHKSIFALCVPCFDCDVFRLVKLRELCNMCGTQEHNRRHHRILTTSGIMRESRAFSTHSRCAPHTHTHTFDHCFNVNLSSENTPNPRAFGIVLTQFDQVICLCRCRTRTWYTGRLMRRILKTDAPNGMLFGNDNPFLTLMRRCACVELCPI
eukprot:3166190-Pyramimonas_sp.AAC.1